MGRKLLSRTVGSLMGTARGTTGNGILSSAPGGSPPGGETVTSETKVPRKDKATEDESQWAKKLTQAVLSNSSEEVATLLKSRDERIRGQNEGTPYGTDGVGKAIFTAIEQCYTTLATQLIDAKGLRLRTTNPANSFNRTALHEAARRENVPVVTHLLKHSECIQFIDLGDSDGRAALHEAAGRGNAEIMRALLMSGADVNVLDNAKMTPLHLVVWTRPNPTGREADLIASELLEVFGAEVNTKDITGNTPLHDACERNDHDMAEILLHNGADAGVRNAKGKTPLDLITGSELRDLFAQPWGISEKRTVPRIPREQPRCPEDKRKACREASVYVRCYWRGRGVSWATSTSVNELVYKQDTLHKISEQSKKNMRMPTTAAAPAPEDGEIWKWIHFPANNMTWIKDLIWTITHSEGYDKDYRNETWSFWERTINHRQRANADCTRIPHAEGSWRESRHRYNTSERKDATPETPVEEGETEEGTSHDEPEDLTGSAGSRASQEERRKNRRFPKQRLSIVLPFIDFETESYLNRTAIPWVRGGGRSEHLKKMMDLFHLYSPYTGQAGLQIPKTLDESYYEMLEPQRITERDGDQVVFKWFQNRISSTEKRSRLYELLDFFSQYRSERVLDDQTTARGEDESRATETQDGDNHGILHGYQDNFPYEGEPPSGAVTKFGSRVSGIAGIQPLRGNPSTGPEGGPVLVGAAAPEHPPGKPPAAAGKVEDIDLKQGGENTDIKVLPKLLMVHQLWLWKLDEITSSPDRCHKGSEDTLIDTVRQGGIESMAEPEDLIEHILYECATFLDEFRYAGLGLHVLDIFDSAIAKISDEEVGCFKAFEKQVGDRAKTDKTRSPSASQSIHNEIRLLYEVRDIRDELNLLRRVFEAQYDVVEKFTRLFWPGSQEESRCCRESFLEDCSIKSLIERTTRLDQDTKETLNALDYLVQVKQAQSSLDEAEATRILNNYIMLFTVVTVLFTPLSFMATLFAIPVEDFPHDDRDNLSFNSGWLTWRMFVGEIATLIVVTMIMWFIWKWVPWYLRKSARSIEDEKERGGTALVPWKLGRGYLG
ncbi:hypothetical protein DL771_007729 [Monosporascus sp. 5C6A]|nr:hypothetical protein DL771_007729 [Monosporascus sp. 5C6A]